MTRAANRQLRKEAQAAPASLPPWTSLTCSLVAEDGWLEREEVTALKDVKQFYSFQIVRVAGIRTDHALKGCSCHVWGSLALVHRLFSLPGIS